MTEREQLNQAIAALEAQRASLGDAIVDTAIAALHEKLAALEPAPPTDQQRKQVTVLFADVSGFTALSETRDVEEVSDTMNALWQRIDAIIVEHGGLIDKHIGDAVMALWSADEVREDDPERAICAALAMQAGLALFREAHDVSLAMRIGINTGPVFLGNVGTTGEFSAIGDTVNLASRFEHAAPVGGVLISHDTYRHVRGIFDVLPQEPITVKGKAEPMQTYVVQRARERAFRVTTRGIEGIKTSMVGRGEKLLALQNIFRDIVTPLTGDARTHVVTVAGEAGVGKSRLLHEFDNWIKLLPDRIIRLKSRTMPEMQTIPYSTVRDMFAFNFDIRDSDSAAAALEKFRAGMANVLEAEKADLVGHFVGFDFDKAGSAAVQNLLGSPSFGELATAYLTNYVRAISSQPVVIFLDDIHWADDSSLDLVEHIVKAIPRARLLIVCLARLRLFERRPDWGKDRDTFTRIDLKPLSKQDSQVLVDEILQKVDQVPDGLRNLIVDGADGNPFYVEELVKMLIEDGVIVRGKDEWHAATDRLKQVRVPSTLTGVLQARLDSLPRQEKMLLQRASVVGRQFWDATVAELEAGDVDGFDQDEIVPLLNAIRDRELIFRRDRSAFAGTNEYIFKHSTLRDVTYETVLLKLRRVYHARVARWLETNAGERLDEYLSLIAGHYEMAGEKAKTADYLRRAGKESLKISAYRDAIGAFERALSLLPESDAASRTALLVELGTAYGRVGDYAVATQHLKAGLALARNADDLQAKALALIGLGRVVYLLGAYDEAGNYLERGLAIARECDDRKGRMRALRMLGFIAFRRGDAETAERYAEESLSISRELGDRREIANALGALSYAAQMQESYQEAERWLEESLTLYREIGERGGAMQSLNNLGEMARIQGRYEEAARYYNQSLAIAEEIGSRIAVAAGLLNLGLVYASLDEDDVSSKYLHGALEESAAIGVVPILLFTLTGIAGLQAKATRYARAAELLGMVLDHPALDAQNEREAESILVMLHEALPANELEAALERGSLLDMDEVVAEILGDTAE